MSRTQRRGGFRLVLLLNKRVQRSGPHSSAISRSRSASLRALTSQMRISLSVSTTKSGSRQKGSLGLLSDLAGRNTKPKSSRGSRYQSVAKCRFPRNSGQRLWPQFRLIWIWEGCKSGNSKRSGSKRLIRRKVFLAANLICEAQPRQLSASLLSCGIGIDKKANICSV